MPSSCHPSKAIAVSTSDATNQFYPCTSLGLVSCCQHNVRVKLIHVAAWGYMVCSDSLLCNFSLMDIPQFIFPFFCWAIDYFQIGLLITVLLWTNILVHVWGNICPPSCWVYTEDWNCWVSSYACGGFSQVCQFFSVIPLSRKILFNFLKNTSQWEMLKVSL